MRGRGISPPARVWHARPVNDAFQPEPYRHFEAERRLPFEELLSGVHPGGIRRAVDLGCGTGKLTAELHARAQAEQTLGVDTSAAMLREAPSGIPGLGFARMDLRDAPIEGADLIFSNAALHWVPDHLFLLRKLHDALASGGQLAVQVPANHTMPTHRASARVAAEPPFAEALGGYVQRYGVLDEVGYAQALHDAGFAFQKVMLRVYPHRLESLEQVVDWMRGAHLTDYAQRLGPALFEEFLVRYRAQLRAHYPADGAVFFPYRRILFWARKA